MIVTSPALTPVTRPFSSTVATSVLSDVYVTFVLAGFTVAVICSVAPTATTSAALRVNVGFLTVALNVNVFFTDLPAFLAVTLTRYARKSYRKQCDKIGDFIEANSTKHYQKVTTK